MENLVSDPNNQLEKISSKIAQIRGNLLGLLKTDYSFETLDKEKIEFIKKLGSGGSKEVLEVKYLSEVYAMGIPGYIDNPQVIAEKWNKVLNEPNNTKIMRDLGYYVNDVFFEKEILMNGISFPIVFMKTYDKHDFKIFDAKNCSNNNNSIFSQASVLDDSLILSSCECLLKEIAKLITDNISLGLDNFNLCVDNTNMHLFFNDLGNMKLGQITQKNIDKYIEYYLMFTIGALLNSFDYNSFKNTPYLQTLEDNEDLLSKMRLKIKGYIEQKNPSPQEESL